MSELSTNLTEIAHSSSTTIKEEFQENTTRDIYLFGISVGLLITFSSLVLSSWNFVSSRVYLATAGVVAVSLGIGASFGLVSSCGLFFVDIIGVMPFLAIGVGVDSMFVILSEWSDHHDKATVEDQLGATLKGCGGSVTIAALTDITAFFIGLSSRFQSIRNFCAYTGVALLFSYVCHMTFFLGCLTIHGKRVRENRHCVTCTPVEQNPQKEKSCRSFVCSGSQPTKRTDEESYCENIPRKILSAFVQHPVSKCIISVLFAGYIAISIWGCLNLKQGLVLNNLVSDDSYFQKYFKWNTENFEDTFVLSVVFQQMNYLDAGNIQSMTELLYTLEAESTIKDNSSLCWYHLFANSAYFNTSSNSAFLSNLQSFLPSVPHVTNDVEFSPDGTLIKASRCYVFSKNIRDTTAQGEFMLRVRELVDASELNVFVFNPVFIFMEQYVSILSGTLLTVGIAIICMFVITLLLMPHPVMVVLVTVNMLSISLGIFGFLYICDLTLSSITMIDLIMSVGFSVDFSVHVCHGFVTSGKPTRKEKTLDAVKTSASPVVNAGLSSLVGVLALAGSQSYVLRAFLIVMVVVICFGLAHSMLLLPAILSVIGPVGREVGENRNTGNQCRPPDEISTTTT
ncbi:hypothetical protein LOTGIDRAFT_108477 [Lottia gigantea]|uniref:SSD domain-containing protein n=1 Tax=Lottia gigantea TaxID=225164 RepID=V3ZT37_LOTGI|nr:hypothetical protein LOTGIDRAFT_108477 [Lottia gigantea]ESO84061.1 hypothetical protein LOTGIDRAFT_108477 [Lottia gigantea]